jgi:hypothetical protein
MSSQPERILLAFSGLSGDAREVVADVLERTRGVPFLQALGSSLTYATPWLAEAVLRLALKRVSWDGSAGLLDRLSDNEPWLTVKQVLAEALATTAAAARAENGP